MGMRDAPMTEVGMAKAAAASPFQMKGPKKPAIPEALALLQGQEPFQGFVMITHDEALL